LFCVLDGHGGNRSANYILDIFPSILAEQIGKNDNITEDIALAFSEADKSLAEHEDFGSGSTCTMCYVNNGFLHFANVGDSKAFIVTDTEATQVNYDHKATDPAEAARIEEAEGVIVQGRIGGVIALTRSFGDGGFKWDGMIATPYVHQPIPITADLRYAVIASDGVWDMVTQEELLPLINESPQEIAKVLINLAIDRDSTDNITIIVLKF
jgi:serine/threonine protein phosphatase PrpC